MSYSVILPTLNEKGHIIELIKKIRFIFSEIHQKYEIILVDDNSTDGTIDLVKNIEKDYDNVKLFVNIKKMFDPYNIMNPNKKITLQGTFVKNFRYGYKRKDLENTLNWQIYDSRVQREITGYRKELSYDNEVDLCHGCGGCRELNFDVRMCPVYKGINDEVASCRGRNNVLRWLFKVNGLAKDFALTKEYKDIIYKYCVQCKMCLVDCPSNVNVGKSIADARAYYAKNMGLPKGYEYFVNIDKYASLGCKIAPLSNFLMNNKLFRKILEINTRLVPAIPASLNVYSKLVNRSS